MRGRKRRDTLHEGKDLDRNGSSSLFLARPANDRLLLLPFLYFARQQISYPAAEHGRPPFMFNNIAFHSLFPFSPQPPTTLSTELSFETLFTSSSSSSLHIDRRLNVEESRKFIEAARLSPNREVAAILIDAEGGEGVAGLETLKSMLVELE